MSAIATPSMDQRQIAQLGRQIRRWILQASTKAESGHPTSSLSAVELMSVLFFGGFFRYDTEQPGYLANDRLIFSKGHASPLFYSLWAAAGEVDARELMTYRDFGSPLEGHPTARFPYTEAATGSLGQGLSIGLGMAIAAKYIDQLPCRSFVLLGDSEMVEGAQWEAIQLASHYQLGNLIGVLDVNRLGQRGETMYGSDIEAYRKRIESFGWQCILVEDGHDLQQVHDAFADAVQPGELPRMIIARTIKGKGVDFLEDEQGWHGKPIDDTQLKEALRQLGEGESDLRGELAKPEKIAVHGPSSHVPEEHQVAVTNYRRGESVATRDAYGNALLKLASKFPQMMVLDGEVCNSTRSQKFRDEFPERFFEMFIAEQNMLGAATGLALLDKLPFVSTFAAFFTRAFDQIRMAPYSEANIKCVGSHSGVSIGKDGPSQMGLEDLAMFRSVLGSVVLYPSDAVATEALVEQMASTTGLAYLRTTRGGTPVIYEPDESFCIGGSKVLRQSANDQITLVAAGITLHESLQAYEELAREGIRVRVIDLYSIKPIDGDTLLQAADDTDLICTVEDHFPEGGLGEAVLSSLSKHSTPVHKLAVHKRPKSGSSKALMDDEGLTAGSIARTVRQLVA